MIEQVKNYIKAHYAEDMSIKELADVAVSVRIISVHCLKRKPDRIIKHI